MNKILKDLALYVIALIALFAITFVFVWYATSDEVWYANQHDQNCEIMLEGAKSCNCSARLIKAEKK